MTDRGGKAKLSILKTLNEHDRPLGATQIAAELLGSGLDLQPRTIRHYLLQLDEQGLTRLASRRLGRVITDRGREELNKDDAISRVGIVSARVDAYGYRMSFDLKTGEGDVIINRSLIDPADLETALVEMRTVFDAGLGVGHSLTVAQLGTRMGSMIVPEGKLAIGTICSVTLNGLLLKQGIPVVSRFGGLLELRDMIPVRFVNMIEYRGSTLDPLEVFIRADMTRVRNAVRSGTGIVCASFREVPAASVGHIRRVERSMRTHRLSGILALGRQNQPLFDIPVSEGYCGMVVLGGLNPIAAAHEAGVSISIKSLADLVGFGELQPIDEVLRKWLP